MKNLKILIGLLFCIAIAGCQKKADKVIKSINLVEKNASKAIVVNQGSSFSEESKTFKGAFSQSKPVIDITRSYLVSEIREAGIVVTDTIMLSVGDTEAVFDPVTDVDYIIKIDIQPGQYYCQSYTSDDKHNCERGIWDTHLNEEELTPIPETDDYRSAEFLFSAGDGKGIYLYKEASEGEGEEKDVAPTFERKIDNVDMTVCVYNDGGLYRFFER